MSTPFEITIEMRAMQMGITKMVASHFAEQEEQIRLAVDEALQRFDFDAEIRKQAAQQVSWRAPRMIQKSAWDAILKRTDRIVEDALLEIASKERERP